MKEFEKNHDVNFTDDNNILVRFNYSQDCCEMYGYFYSLDEPVGVQDDLEDMDKQGYSFDTSYFNLINSKDAWDEGGMAIFKLVNDKKEELFLCFHNSHEGYYGHCFSMSEIGGKTLYDGCL